MIDTYNKAHTKMARNLPEPGDNILQGDYHLQPKSEDVFADAEMEFASEHLEKIKRFAVTDQDIVFVAVPMSEISWLGIVEACIYAGAEFILPEPENDIASIAKTILREKVTVVAIEQRIWAEVCQVLAEEPEEFRHIRTIFFNK